MTLGKKRNVMHEKCKGEIIIYMDDDDYYPPERISHAVETLIQNPQALCAGSSGMYIYFKHINEMYQFGPYKDNHSTAATFAFRRELLKQTQYDNYACIAEEKQFLKNYTIPLVQLDPMKSILVFSHNHNSFDKKMLLENKEKDRFIKLSDKTVDDFVKDPSIKHFIMVTIDEFLEKYEPGDPKYKPDVLKQMSEMKERREKIIEHHKKEQDESKQKMNSIVNNSKNIDYSNKFQEQSSLIMELMRENRELKEKMDYLEKKIKDLISNRIQEMKATTK
jgi:glycosyltransferase involved in cell wall biosynthesis